MYRYGDTEVRWSSHATTLWAYDEIVKTPTAWGKPVLPHLFAHEPPLSSLNTMIIYVPLIGVLLAVVVGKLSITGDRAAQAVACSRAIVRSRIMNVA